MSDLTICTNPTNELSAILAYVKEKKETVQGHRKLLAREAELAKIFFDIADRIDDKANSYIDHADASGQIFKGFPASILKPNQFAMKFARLLGGHVTPIDYGGEYFHGLIPPLVLLQLPRIDEIAVEMNQALDCWVEHSNASKANAWLERLNADSCIL